MSPQTPGALKTVTVPMIDIKTPSGSVNKQASTKGWHHQTNLSTPNFHENSVQFPISSKI